MTLEPGLRAAFRYTVTGADTAPAVGSGEVPVLERVAGRRLQFAVRLRDGGRPVASGLITRVVVDAATFLRNVGAEAAG